MTSWEWLFALFGIALTLVPLGLEKLGVEVPRSVFSEHWSELAAWSLPTIRSDDLPVAAETPAFSMRIEFSVAKGQ